MLSTFYIAPRVAQYFQQNHQLELGLACALAVPALTQLVTVPFHVAAFDLYNRPDASFSERLLVIKREYFKVAFGRTIRVIPAFGLGSYTNTLLRSRLIS